MFLGYGGEFLNADGTPAVNSEAGVNALETMMAMTEYMDPEYLVSDSTYVQQQFQQGRIAMANLWGSRGAAMDDEAKARSSGWSMPPPRRAPWKAARRPPPCGGTGS